MTEASLDTLAKHQELLTRAFLIPQRQERYLWLFANPRRRKDVLRELAHFKHLDYRWTIPIPSNSRLKPELLSLLKSKGAPQLCWAISEDDELDGKQLDLSQALTEVLCRGMGTFLSCLPGRLACFEDEEERWILERKEHPLNRQDQETHKDV
jgi:hypothetical protein